MGKVYSVGSGASTGIIGPGIIPAHPASLKTTTTLTGVGWEYILFWIIVVLLVLLLVAGITILVCRHYEKRYKCLIATQMEKAMRRGKQGCQGLPGKNGRPGYNGVCGNQGDRGPNGGIGLQGSQGPEGVQGDSGQQGMGGTQGLQGVQGSTGNTGTNGAQGVQGVVGPQGIPGSSTVLSFSGTGSFIIETNLALTIGADTLFINSPLFVLGDTFIAEAGVIYRRLPRNGIISNIYGSVQLANPLVTTIPTEIILTIYIAPSPGDASFSTQAPTFSITGLQTTIIIPVAQTFATNNSLINSVSANAGDFICLVISAPISSTPISSAFVSIQAAVEFF